MKYLVRIIRNNAKKSDILLFVLLLVLLCIQFLCSTEIIDRYYTNLAFVGIRKLTNLALGWMPFPPMYLFNLVVLILLFRGALYFLRKGRRKWLLLLFFIIRSSLWLFVSFHIMWGLNYKSLSLKDRLNLSHEVISMEELKRSTFEVVDSLNSLRQRMDGQVEYRNSSDLDGLISELGEQQRKVFKGAGIKDDSEVILRVIYPKGVLLHFSTAGIYYPFVEEGHIDGGLHYLQWPATLAHEMAHGYGIGDEGECNFIAILTCLRSPRLDIQYSGLLMYYRYLARAIYSDKSAYAEVQANVSKVVKNDLATIRAELNKYPDVFPDLRNLIYDTFLKSNGIKKGIKSYGTVINNVFSYEKRYGSIYRNR